MLYFDLCRDVHSVCSWDEKASVRIQDALRTEILHFIAEAQGVSVCVCVCVCVREREYLKTRNFSGHKI